MKPAQAGLAVLKEIGELFRQPSFPWLLVSYGVNVGTFYAVSTLLAQFLLPLFPDLLVSIAEQSSYPWGGKK
jgi:hypothetical protein